MIEATYELHPNEAKTRFSFQSIGPKGIIEKEIRFTKLDENLWNLGFADLLHGSLDDRQISNNGDLVQVISTVAKAALEFSKTWPARRLLIVPVDEKRKRLYQVIFRRHIATINKRFQVQGFEENRSENWQPDGFYQAYILTPRSITFVQN